MYRITILLAEDHTIVRKGLRALLEAEADMAVVAEAEDGRAAVQLAQQRRPDVVVMDISMPGLNGIEATRQIKAQLPDTKVLILTRHADETYIHAILGAGGSGYIVKKAAPTELIAAIRAVYHGNVFFGPEAAGIAMTGNAGATPTSEDRYTALTPREREVLQLVAEGHPNRDIADVLHISVKTVENHKASLMDKLGVHSTAALTQYAIRKGVISLDS